MKSKIIKRFATVLAFLMLATTISLPVYATNSTTTNDPTPTLISGEDETSDEEETSDGIPTPTLYESTTTATLSEEVDETNVVDVLSDDIEDADDEDAEDLVEQAAEEVAESLEGESQDDIVTALDDLEQDVQDEIDALKAEIAKDPSKRVKLQNKMLHLQRLMIKLRVKLLAKNKLLAAKMQGVKNPKAVFELRWGNLTGQRPKCTGVSMKEIRDALVKNEIPEKCQDANKVDYTGKLSVDTGSLEVKKELLFEEGDEVTTSSGSSVEFESTIAGSWDGIMVEYTPDETSTAKKNEVMFTLSIGDLDQTYKGSELLGTKKIGNNHTIQIRRLAQMLPGVSASNATQLLKNKLQIQNKISNMQGKLQRMRLMNKGGTANDELEDIIDEAGEYNFDDTSAAEVEDAIADAVDELTDSSTDTDMEDVAKALKDKIEKIKAKAKGLKFTKNLIPFKDTDDDQWYTAFVSGVKKRGIISGYKDAAGNELGEYRPGNNITVAEILKIGMETAKEGKAAGKTPKLRAAVNHWAKEYVAKAEELGLTLTSSDVDLNRPATRGEVIRLILETLGMKPPKASKTDFSDVPATDLNAEFIQYAKELGLISGDAGKTTFRPNDPINRAEAAKISDLVFQIIFGGSDTIGGDEPWE